MRYDSVFIPKKVFISVAYLFESSMIFFNMPMFGMNFFKLLSGDLIENFTITFQGSRSIMVCIEKGILFKDPYKSNIFQMQYLSIFSKRIFRYSSVLFRVITGKSIGLESEEKTNSSFHEELHVVL
jgi:hypothetical protein